LLARENRRVDALVVAEQLHARSRLDAIVGHTGETGVRARASSALSLGRRLHAAAPSLDELLAVMRGREILMFAEAGADLWRFHIVDGAVARLDLVPPRAQPLLERWRKAPDDRALADELGELLIPAAAAAPSPQPLYLVTSGTLDALPFAALRRGGRFLVEDRALARLPDVAALRCPTRRLARRSSVFLGDSRDDLPAARKETRALSELLGGTALVGAEATVERLEASRDAALLHLAVHADVDRTGARLLLAGQRQVSAAEIVERDIGPRVAVLAGCATAIGRDAEGWGALSSAFLTAGSRSVVGTLQAVSDTDAFEIMRRFYRHGGDRQPAAALAAAQRELLASPPSVWAAFVVHGSAEATDCEGTP
jgi:CHAT domain-containing protein